MHTLIDQKGVWKQSLKNTCSRNALFEPSFPLDLMTIDDLKHAALGPALWHHTVLWAPSRGSSEIPSMPHTERCISSQYENSWTPTGVFLIPGGRFLLCTSRAAISLKDLGVAGPSFEVHKEPVVLGVVYMKYDWQVIGISTPIRHGRDSIRFVVGIGIPGSDIRLRVYEIGPIPKDCALRQVGRDLKIAYTPAMRRTWIGSQDRVYIHFKNDAAVWDYSLHRIWFWSIAKEGVREITHVGKGDLLVGLTPTGAVLWEVPWLSRIDDLGSKFILDITANSDASAPTILEPCYEVEYPRALQPGNFVSTFSLGLSSGWYESEYKSDASATANPNPGCHHHAAILPPALVIYDVIGHSRISKGSVATVRYRLDISPGRSTLGVRLTTLAKVAFEYPSHGMSSRLASLHQASSTAEIGNRNSFDGSSGFVSTVFSGWGKAPLMLLYSDLSIGAPGELQNDSVLTVPGECLVRSIPVRHLVGCGSFCAASGRLVYLCENEHGGVQGRIHVVDLLV